MRQFEGRAALESRAPSRRMILGRIRSKHSQALRCESAHSHAPQPSHERWQQARCLLPLFETLAAGACECGAPTACGFIAIAVRSTGSMSDASGSERNGRRVRAFDASPRRGGPTGPARNVRCCWASECPVRAALRRLGPDGGPASVQFMASTGGQAPAEDGCQFEPPLGNNGRLCEPVHSSR